MAAPEQAPQQFAPPTPGPAPEPRALDGVVPNPTIGGGLAAPPPVPVAAPEPSLADLHRQLAELSARFPEAAPEQPEPAPFAWPGYEAAPHEAPPAPPPATPTLPPQAPPQGALTVDELLEDPTGAMSRFLDARMGNGAQDIREVARQVAHEEFARAMNAEANAQVGFESAVGDLGNTYFGGQMPPEFNQELRVRASRDAGFAQARTPEQQFDAVHNLMFTIPTVREALFARVRAAGRQDRDQELRAMGANPFPPTGSGSPAGFGGSSAPIVTPGMTGGEFGTQVLGQGSSPATHRSI